jgi:hypothetical protein
VILSLTLTLLTFAACSKKVISISGNPSKVSSTTISSQVVSTEAVSSQTTSSTTVSANPVVSSKQPTQELIAIPNLVGNKLEYNDRVYDQQVGAKLEALGLKAELIPCYSDKYSAMKIYKTSPAANSKVSKGSLVKLYYSMGKATVKAISVGSKAEKPSSKFKFQTDSLNIIKNRSTKKVTVTMNIGLCMYDGSGFIAPEYFKYNTITYGPHTAYESKIESIQLADNRQKISFTMDSSVWVNQDDQIYFTIGINDNNNQYYGSIDCSYTGISWDENN